MKKKMWKEYNPKSEIDVKDDILVKLSFFSYLR